MAIGVVFLGSSAASAQECGYGGCPATTTTASNGMTFTIDDTTVVAGQTVGVSGTGCAPGETVTFTIGDTEVGTTTADDNGDYSGSITIPNLPAGEYTVEASCGTGVLGLNVTVGTGSGSGGGGLARTGSDLGPLAGIGAAALVLGGAAVYGTRRRRQTI